MKIESTNNNKTNNYISFQMIEKKDHNICRWKSSSWLGTGRKMYRQKNGITTLCLLDNWIYNDNTDKNKQKMSA